jgi:hypothetical protein
MCTLCLFASDVRAKSLVCSVQFAHGATARELAMLLEELADNHRTLATMLAMSGSRRAPS